ncbi:MAG: diguanylate cyclase [Proteobacteria bacterium]|nr:diguanylate cyclase [Pseudomonadota bacterium]
MTTPGPPNALGDGRNLPRGLTALSFFQIAETANDIVIVTTPDLEPPGPMIVYVNPAFTRLTGYSASEAVGRSPRMLQGPASSRVTLDAIKAALLRGEAVREKILNFAKGGAPYWLDLHIVPLRDARGTVTHFAAIERDVTQDKRRVDELEVLADRDTLTGIPNRRVIVRTTEAEIEAAKASGGCAPGPSLAFIDVDRFKQINDRFGHAAGDEVLFEMAGRLTENTRRLDTVGRLGGEEFAVCMPGASRLEAYAIAERLCRAVAAEPILISLGPVPVTVSIGVTGFTAGDTIDRLFELADGAMYAAKRAGGNRVMASRPYPNNGWMTGDDVSSTP